MFHSACVMENENTMVIFGGREGPEKPLNDVYSFNMDEMKWSKVECSGDLPEPRWRHSSVIIGDIMLIFGGRDKIQVFGNMYSLDLKSGKWTKVNSGF